MVTGKFALNSGTYLLTYSMVQSPSWEANWFAAIQETPRISRNPKVHYRTHKRRPPVSILGQPNPVHIPTSNILEIHPNIIHPSTSRSPQWLFPSGFPSKTLYTPVSSPIRATCPVHLILLDFITRTILGEEYKSFSSSLCSLLHSPRYLVPPRFNSGTQLWNVSYNLCCVWIASKHKTSFAFYTAGCWREHGAVHLMDRLQLALEKNW